MVMPTLNQCFMTTIISKKMFLIHDISVITEVRKLVCFSRHFELITSFLNVIGNILRAYLDCMNFMHEDSDAQFGKIITD